MSSLTHLYHLGGDSAEIAQLTNNNMPLNDNGFATGPGTTPTSPAIISSAPVWQDFNSATSNLNGLINTPDPYMSLFQQAQQANALTAENAIASASAATQRQKQGAEQNQNALVAGLNTAAEKTGLAPNSTYQMQVIQGAQDQYHNRFMLLDQTEKLAIAKAKAAQQVGDVAVLKQQLDYVNELRKAKAQALKDANDRAWDMQKHKDEMALGYARIKNGVSGSLGIKNDVAEAVIRFQDLIKNKGFYGADPREYKAYKDYLRTTYGAAAALELDKALEDAGISVDFTGDNEGGNL